MVHIHACGVKQPHLGLIIGLLAMALAIGRAPVGDLRWKLPLIAAAIVVAVMICAP